MNAGRFLPAAAAAGFFWIFSAHVATGLLDFMTKDGVGGRSGMVALIDDAINGALVDPFGRPVACLLLFLMGAGAAWLVNRAT